MERVYQQLALGDFAPVRPRIAAFLATQTEYRTNRHELSDDLQQRIRQRWAEYFERYGYS
jgi:hypothetical protein